MMEERGEERRTALSNSCTSERESYREVRQSGSREEKKKMDEAKNSPSSH